jgi:glyoxylase-like metal-dependent hydrolase (beta-lactamase superfamily II)
MTELIRTNAVPGREGESIEHLRLGGLELWILPDMSAVQDAGLFALEAGEQEITAVIRDRLLPGNQLRLSACPILLKRNGDLILIDAGIGTHDPSNPGKLPQQLATIGVRPEEISASLITHLHADHIGGAFDSKTGQLLFPNAVFYIPEPEISFWKNPDVSHLRKVPPELIEFTIRTAQRAIECLPIKTFSFGNALFPGIQPIALPGHTAGQAGYLLTATGEDKQFLIGGDSMHHSVLHVQHPEWTTNGDSHPYLVHETRLQLLNRLADRNILFRCYHFAPDENGYVKKDAEGRFRFELA